LTIAQQRANLEIDAAREQIASMSPAEIRRRTAKQTDTGRENPDYDPGLARAASLASRRKLGADNVFDDRINADPAPVAAPGIDRAELGKRFRSDRQMNAYRLGTETQKGYEVLDASGKVVGHYR
jgi:hypothetical protein